MANHMRWLMMIVSIIWFVTMVELPMIGTAAKPSKRKEEATANWLVSESAKRPIIKLESATVQSIVFPASRNYQLMLFITSSNQCPVCRSVLNELFLLAKAYETDRSNSRHSIFFVVLDAAQASNSELFTELNITTVPHLIHIPAGKEQIEEMDLMKAELYPQYNLREGQQAEKIRLFVQRHTGQEVPFDREELSGASLQRTANMMMMILLVIALAAVGREMWPHLRKHYRKPTFWFGISMIFYTFCISGGMFNIIRGVPFMSMTQQGTIMVFYPGDHMQLGIEGYIIGIINGVCAGMVILLNTRVLTLDGEWRQWGAFICVAVLHLFFTQIRAFYTMKHPSYHHGMVL